MADLKLCNLVSQGLTLKQAREKLYGVTEEGTERTEAPPAPEPKVPEEPKKLSASEKKKLLAAEIEALGGDVPNGNSSVAKFEEALTAAKTAIVEKEQAEAADAAQEVADKEQAEADAAADELM